MLTLGFMLTFYNSQCNNVMNDLLIFEERVARSNDYQKAGFG